MSKSDLPRDPMTAFECFVHTCLVEHKKDHPRAEAEKVLKQYSRKCAEYWKSMDVTQKMTFEDMAAEDRIRYKKEMSTYENLYAPKRAMSAYFFFCTEERPSVEKEFPDYGVGEVAIELGKRWGVCPNKQKFEELAANDKKRYTEEMMAYKQGAAPAKEAKPAAAVAVEEDDEEEEWETIEL